MKKRYLLAILFLSALLVFSCENGQGSNESTTGVVTVYTTSPSKWSLIIDGKEYGKIKNASQMPVCGDPDFQNITLSAGSHSFDAKSLNGYAWGNPKNIDVPSGGCKQVKLP